MIGVLIQKYFGWKHPELPYKYSVTRVGRDLFEIELNGRRARVSAEVGEKSNGHYQIAIFPGSTRSWNDDASPMTTEEHELVLVTFEKFLVENKYAPRRK